MSIKGQPFFQSTYSFCPSKQQSKIPTRASLRASASAPAKQILKHPLPTNRTFSFSATQAQSSQDPIATICNQSNTMSAATSTKSVSFDGPRPSSVTSSTKSIKAESVGPYGKKQYVSNVCYSSGKWYDCLRPTTKPYQGFGGMSDFSDSAPDTKFAGTQEDWTRDIHHQGRGS
jgi:hypothetical protein